MKKLICVFTVVFLSLGLTSCIHVKKDVKLLQTDANIHAIEIYDLDGMYTERNIDLLREQEKPALILEKEQYSAFLKVLSPLEFEEVKVLLPIVWDGGCDYTGYVISIVYQDGSYDVIAQGGSYSYAIDIFGRGWHKYDHSDYCGNTPWAELFSEYVEPMAESTSESEDTAEPTVEAVVPEILQAALFNEAPWQAEIGNIAFADGRLGCESLDPHRCYFALVDMNGDGVMEAIVNDIDDIVMLYCYGGEVLAEYYTFRSMDAIQQDGRFSWNYMDGSGHYYGEGRLEFYEGKWKTVDLWSVYNDGEPDARYVLLGKEVSLEEMKEYWNEQEAADIKYTSWTKENVREAFS